MMEKLKRHAFLLILAAGVVVVSIVVIAVSVVWFQNPNAKMRQMLASTKTGATQLVSGPLYTADLVKIMADQVDRRKKQYDDLLKYVSTLGAKRAAINKDVFPSSPDVVRHLFKPAYDKALEGFMGRLGAVTPATPSEKDGKISEAEKERRMRENRQAKMYAHLKASFSRPDWVDKTEAPTMEQVRQGQENLWLMENLVDIIAGLNDEVLKADKKLEPKIANVPIKELNEIDIGGEHAVLSSTKMPALPGRYRPTPLTARGGAGGKEESARATTVSGHWSQPDERDAGGRVSKYGMYKVLPFRLVVVADARYAGELLRRLKGTESFLSVEAWRLKPITEATFRDVFAFDRKDYGNQGVVRLEVVGESIVFQLDGGRVTTQLKTPAAPAPETPAAAPTAKPKQK